MALDLAKTKELKPARTDRRWWKEGGSCEAARTTGFESCIRQAEAFGICRAFCVSAQNFFGQCQANIFQRHRSCCQFSRLFRGPVFPPSAFLAVVALFAFPIATAQLVRVPTIALHLARFSVKFAEVERQIGT